MNYNLTTNAFLRYPPHDYLKTDGYIPYEILDDPLSDECHKILKNMWFSDEGEKILFMEKSGMPNVQNFFQDIIRHEQISHIAFESQSVHYYGKFEFLEYEIKADAFCKTIMEAVLRTHYSGLPKVRFKIIK